MSVSMVEDDGRGMDDDFLGRLSLNELIAVVVCSVAGLVLVILMTVLVVLLIAIRRKS